jgi:hypothetical protein
MTRTDPTVLRRPAGLAYIPTREYEARERNLPKWAQAKIAHMRQSLTDALRRAEDARLATAPELCDTLLDPHGHTLGLGKGVQVRFVIDDTDPEAFIDVHRTGDMILVHGGGKVWVYPVVNNSVEVAVETRRHRQALGEAGYGRR